MTDPPLTPTEVRAWVHGLASTDAKRLGVLRDLLRHANEDQMSVADREICQQEITRLLEAAVDSRGVKLYRSHLVRRAAHERVSYATQAHSSKAMAHRQ